MNLTCPHCNTKLNLPDDRIPKHRDSSFKCPKCKGAVQVKASQPSQQPSQQAVPPSPSELSDRLGDLSLGGGAGKFSRSTRARSLVCISSSFIKSQMSSAIKRLGFSVEFPENFLKALKDLEYHLYPLVVVDDAFDPDRQMVAHLNEMDMSLRRRICLVRICPGEETANAMAALHSSANAVIRIRDIEEEDDLYIEDVLSAAITEHEQFYSIFKESLKAVGKA